MIRPTASRLLVGSAVQRFPLLAPGPLRSSFRTSRSTKRTLETSGTTSGRTWSSRHTRRLLVGVGLFGFVYKSYAAIRPLFGGEASDEDSVANGPAPEPSEPPILRHLGIAWDASDRLARVVFTVAAIILEYRTAPQGADWSEVHQRSANRLLRLCRVNQGVYVKLAQHLAQLDHLLPSQYVSTMRGMLHAAPRDTFASVAAVFAEEFPGCSLADAFERVDEEPIASASLAQVHVAYLKGSGRRVAVKVQHAGLEAMASADIATITALVHLVKALFPQFNYEWLADEVARNLPIEMNFLAEASHCERTGRLFTHRADVSVPQVYHEWTSRRVITMSFEDGVYVNDVDAIRAMGLSPIDVARVVSEAFCEQIFVHGIVHADPHFANLLVRPLATSPGRPQLVLLDHGLYRDLPVDLRMNYARLWQSIISSDEEGIKRYSSSMNAGDLYQLWSGMLTQRTWDRIMEAGEDIESLRSKASRQERDELRSYALQYQREIQQLLCKIPRELLLILKTNDCLRSVDKSLGAPVNTFVISAQYIQRAINAERLRERPGVVSWLQNAKENALLWIRLQFFKLQYVASTLSPFTGLGSSPASSSSEFTPAVTSTSDSKVRVKVAAD